MSKLTIGNDKNMEELINQGTLSIVKYSASWCGPCKMLAPIIEELANDYGDINFVEVDIDDEGSEKSVQSCRISVVPTVIFYKKGEEVERFSGFKPKEEIIKIINKHTSF